jgi:hypothetical protein
MRTLPAWETRMGVCETNSLEESGPSRPRRRQGRSSSRAPPEPGSSQLRAPARNDETAALDRPDLMGARGHATADRLLIRPATMVGQAGAGSSRTDQPQGRPSGGQRGLGHSRCRRQPASTQTRHHSQHHSEDYCEGGAEEVDWQGGRVLLPSGCPTRRVTTSLTCATRPRLLPNL